MLNAALIPQPGVLKKAGGPSEEQLRRVLVPSGTCVLGLVQHLAEVEPFGSGTTSAGPPGTLAGNTA